MLPAARNNLSERLKRRLFWYSAAALLILAVGVGLATVTPLSARLKQAEEAGLAHIAETRALAVGEWYRRACDLAWQVTSRTRIREELEAYNSGKITLEQIADFTRPKLADAMNLSKEVVGITRLDAQNRPVTSVGLRVPLDIPPPAKRASRSLSLSAPLLLGRTRCIIIAAPILNRQSMRVGTDLVAVDISILLDIVYKTEEIRGGGKVRLGYRTPGGIALFPDPSRPVGRDQLVQGRKGLERALAGQSGIVVSGDSVTAYTPVHGSGWGLIVGADARKLYGPIRARLLSLLGYTAAIYALCLLGLWIFLRPLTGKLLLHASELESEIEAKTTSLKAELAARQSAEQALQEAHQKLEDRVEERTRELAHANRQLRTMHQKLEAEHRQRKALSKELINLLEGVRLDVARELHDHTGQLLTTLRLDLQSALQSMPSASDSCRIQLQNAAEKVNWVQRDIKSISKGLRPDTLEYLGLLPALEALLDEFRNSTGLQIYFFHNEVPKRFDSHKELALYRIAQEALNNVVKHASAKAVHVNLVFRPPSLSLTVEDDGVGFDPMATAESTKVTGSLGLTLMKERMVQLEGDFSLESNPGSGTQILAEIKV